MGVPISAVIFGGYRRGDYFKHWIDMDKEVLECDCDKYIKEAEGIENYYRKFGNRLPAVLSVLKERTNILSDYFEGTAWVLSPCFTLISGVAYEKKNCGNPADFGGSCLFFCL